MNKMFSITIMVDGLSVICIMLDLVPKSYRNPFWKDLLIFYSFVFVHKYVSKKKNRVKGFFR